HLHAKYDQPGQRYGGRSQQTSGTLATPSVNRPTSRSGCTKQQTREQPRQVIVVEVVGNVDQLDVTEAQNKQRGADPIEEPERHRCRANQESPKDRVHARGGQCLDPAEAPVPEVKSSIDAKVVEPTIGQKPRHADRHHGPKAKPEGGQPSEIDRFRETGEGPFVPGPRPRGEGRFSHCPLRPSWVAPD